MSVSDLPERILQDFWDSERRKSSSWGCSVFARNLWTVWSQEGEHKQRAGWVLYTANVATNHLWEIYIHQCKVTGVNSLIGNGRNPQRHWTVKWNRQCKRFAKKNSHILIKDIPRRNISTSCCLFFQSCAQRKELKKKKKKEMARLWKKNINGA